MNNHLFSIIMPAFNCESIINKAIESVIRQNFESFELIIVDDGSTDNTKSIVDKYLKDKRIKYIYQDNSGVSSARNKGIESANGDYVLFLDSDDYLEYNTLNSIMEIIKEYNPDLIKFNYVIEKGFLKRKYTFSSPTNVLINKNEFGSLVYNNLLTSYDYNNIWNIAIKKEIIRNIRFNNKYINAEDLDFMSKVLKTTESIYITDRVFYHYYYNPNSVSHKKDIQTSIKRFEDIVNVYRNINREYTISNEDYISRIEKDLENCLICICYNTKNYKEYFNEFQKMNFLNKIEHKELFDRTKYINKKYYYSLKIKLIKDKIKRIIIRIVG